MIRLQTLLLKLNKGNLTFISILKENGVFFSLIRAISLRNFYSYIIYLIRVCTTELGRVAQLKSEWEKRNVKVVALSVDSVKEHHEWIKDINETQKCVVDYPIIADSDRSVSVLYGMLDQTNIADTGLPLTVRSVLYY